MNDVANPTIKPSGDGGTRNSCFNLPKYTLKYLIKIDLVRFQETVQSPIIKLSGDGGGVA